MPSRPSTPPKSAGSARDDERAEKTTEILKKIRTLEIKTRGLVETALPEMTDAHAGQMKGPPRRARVKPQRILEMFDRKVGFTGHGPDPAAP